VALGVHFLHEPLTGTTVAGAALVVASVALVIQGGRRAAPASPQPAAVSAEAPVGATER
jgi:drug/metabolite transporter (DMT)-like permease